MKTLFIYLFILAVPASLFAQNPWVFKKEKDGIKIYSRHSDISRFNDLKIEVDLPGTPAQLGDILFDVEKYPQWAYGTKTCVLVKKINNREIIYYSEIDVPWPASNRDFYANFKLTYDSSGRSLNVISVGLKNYQPDKKDLVRIPLSRGLWNVSAISDKKIHLQYILQLDPGGSVPTWVLNLFATKGPLETFENLKKKMESLNK
jgi:hypothetical protein